MKHGRRFFGRLQLPSFASGSQKIGDFLGVALQVQQHEVLFASLKRTYLMFVILIISRGLIERLIYKITVLFAFSAFSAVIEHGLSFFPCSLVFFKVINLGLS